MLEEKDEIEDIQDLPRIMGVKEKTITLI